MKTNKILMALMTLFVISIVLLGVFAYKGNPLEKGPNYKEDVHQQLQAALEAKDYDAWLKIRQENNLPMRGRIFQVINEDNFEKYVELHSAIQNNDAEKANTIRAELGLGQGQMKNQMNKGNYENTKGTGLGMKLQKMQGIQSKQRINNNRNFVDADGDGKCDNFGLRAGRVKTY